MKTKIKMVNDDSWDEGKYCDECGGKNGIIPTGYFDKKTGKTECLYKCMNPLCNLGQDHTAEERRSNCKHDWVMNWVLIFPEGWRCKKCGAEKGGTNGGNWGGGI